MTHEIYTRKTYCGSSEIDLRHRHERICGPITCTHIKPKLAEENYEKKKKQRKKFEREIGWGCQLFLMGLVSFLYGSAFALMAYSRENVKSNSIINKKENYKTTIKIPSNKIRSIPGHTGDTQCTTLCFWKAIILFIFLLVSPFFQV